MSREDAFTPAGLTDLAWRRQVEDRLAELERGSKLAPPVAHPLVPYGGDTDLAWSIAVTHAAFDGDPAGQPWRVYIDRLVRRALIVRVPWVTGSATTGELRITGIGFANDDSDLSTSAVALGAASSGLAVFAWVHGGQLWTPGREVVVEARRTAGAANVDIGYPGAVLQVGPEGCTTTGV